MSFVEVMVKGRFIIIIIIILISIIFLLKKKQIHVRSLCVVSFIVNSPPSRLHCGTGNKASPSQASRNPEPPQKLLGPRECDINIWNFNEKSKKPITKAVFQGTISEKG